MNKLCFFAILSLVFYGISFAGEENNNIIVINQLTDSCWKYMRSYDTINSKKFCLYILERSAKTNNKLTLSEVYRTIANYYLITNNYEKSLDYYERSIKLSQTLTGKEGRLKYAQCLCNYALVFYNNGDYNSALEKYLKAENIFYSYQDYSDLAEVYNKLAGINNALLRPEKAFAYNKKAYDLGLKSNDKFLLAQVYQCYASNMVERDSFEIANHHYNKALLLAKDIGAKKVESDIYYNMAFCLSKQNRFNEALNLYEKAYNLTKETGNKGDQCDALYKIGLMHYYLHDYQKARQVLTNLLTLAQSKGLLIQQRNAFDVLSCIEHETGNDKKAFDYLNRYIDKIYEIYTEEDQKQVNFMNGKFQAQKRETDIYRLETEKKFQTEQMRKKNFLIIIIGILFFFTFFSGTLLLRYYSQKQKLIIQENEIQKHKIRELENEKVLLATQSVLQGEEAERQRLARDLHDGLGGMLFGVKLTLTNIKGNVLISNESVKDFDRALEMLDTSIIELRRVAHNMMPETLLKFGLKDTLDDFCESLKASHAMDIQFQFIGQFQRLEQQLEINAFRIIQELIGNAIKHSGASELLLQIIQEPSRLCLIVQDNGSGFDVNKAANVKGIGLKSVKSRVESMKGRIDFCSTPGKGTEINVEFTI